VGPASGAADGGQPSATEAVRGVAGLASTLGAELGVAVAPIGGGDVITDGTLRVGPAWSTAKVPIAIRVIEDAGGPGALSSAQADLIERALTLSDNEAAAELFAELEHRYGGTAGAASAVTEVLRAGGDSATDISTVGRDGFSPYGQTAWALADQARFVGELAGGCVADGATSDYVLRLMGAVTSDTWGLGSLPGDDEWKGGWGPGTDGRYLARQMGVIELPDGSTAAVAIAARAGDGSFESAQAAATQLAELVYHQSTAPPTSSCD
jgi:hypothetical protein